MSILILTGCTIAGAFLGIALFGGYFIREATKARMIANWEREAADALRKKHAMQQTRINDALSHIPAYSRGANGTAQKIWKILRGEAA